MTTKTAADYREEAAQHAQHAQDSFERCDTDGALSQFASGINATLASTRASIVENGGLSRFDGLYEGDRRVKARLINTDYGRCWLLHEDEIDLIIARRKKFIPYAGFRTVDDADAEHGYRVERRVSRVQKQLGLTERTETAPAWADLAGSGYGISGLHTVHVEIYRSGDKWGSDATPVDEEGA